MSKKHKKHLEEEKCPELLILIAWLSLLGWVTTIVFVLFRHPAPVEVENGKRAASCVYVSGGGVDNLGVQHGGNVSDDPASVTRSSAGSNPVTPQNLVSNGQSNSNPEGRVSRTNTPTEQGRFHGEPHDTSNLTNSPASRYQARPVAHSLTKNHPSKPCAPILTQMPPGYPRSWAEPHRNEVEQFNEETREKP